MKKFLKIKDFYFLVALLSILSILSAVYIEKVLEAIPCKLCVYQRIPYIFSIFFCFLGYIYNKNLLWIYLLITTFLFSFILAGYHVGIENNLFPEFSGCKADNLNILDKEKLLESLSKSIPNCKEITFKLFGLSLATINLFVSLFILCTSIIVIKNEKN
tara:strand:+ start:2378 stop:2854 length:477 start_codon:yes stop_codon:yes gene_type:complete